MSKKHKKGGKRVRDNKGHAQPTTQSPSHTGPTSVQASSTTAAKPSHAKQASEQSNDQSVTTQAAQPESPQTQDQKRAHFALTRVETHLQKINETGTKKEYKAAASGLPAMIQMNGLGQAAAFYRMKGGQHLALYQLLSDWLTSTGQPYSNRQNDLLDAITTTGMAPYLVAQAEAQALLSWVKKFTAAFVRED